MSADVFLDFAGSEAELPCGGAHFRTRTQGDGECLGLSFAEDHDLHGIAGLALADDFGGAGDVAFDVLSGD